MNLIGEDYEITQKKDKSKKTATILLISIIIVFILIIVLVCIIAYLKGNTLTVTLDGQANADIKEMLIFEEDGTIYVPIRDIAKYLNYRSYNGDYTNKSEETNQCYIESDTEVATFSVNSNKIYKISSTTTDYEYYYIDKPIKSINGKLYATTDGIEKAFNVSFVYNKDKKRVIIKTMDYIFDSYQDGILNYGYDSVSDKFDDKKAILNNLAIVSNDRQEYGIFNVNTDEILLETKYDSISYIPTTGDFFVESNDKIGIISSQGKTKVKISYDSIKIMDQDLRLYLVEKDNKYGVIDVNEKIIIPIEYDEIGIDISNFEKNNIKNKFIFVDNLIPVRKNKLWGLFDLKGEQVTDYKYDSFGYIATTNREAENLLVIPNYNVIVACKDKRYIVINSLGEELWNGNSFDEVYMKVNNTYDDVKQVNVNTMKYYIILNEVEYDAEEQLEKIGVSAKKNDESDSEQEQNSNKKNTNKENSNNNKVTEQDNSNDDEQQNEDNSNDDEQQNKDNRNDSEQQDEDNRNDSEQQNEDNTNDDEQQDEDNEN